MPDPSWPSIVELATELWGEPNSRVSRDDIRFGAKDSKSVKPSAIVWNDHESGDGGGYVEIWRLARRGAPLPRRATARPKSKPGNGLGAMPWENIGIIYHYHDADGDLILEVVRTLTGAPRFLPAPAGRHRPVAWSVKDLPGHDCLLYRLPGLRASGDATVWIAEGEKDVDRLTTKG